MNSVIITLVSVFALGTLAVLIWLINTAAALRRDFAASGAAAAILQQQLENLKTSQDNSAADIRKSMQDNQSSLNENLQSSQKVLGQLHSQIGQLQGTNKQMIQVSSEVRRLHDILGSPKTRGQLGEWSLENMLSQVLPSSSYKLQHPFKDGKIVDALVQMPDYAVSVDAKFPLPSFEKILNAETDEQKIKERRVYLRDVAAHVDKIADCYIRPAEGTLDFALMYIPAENVYYETIVSYPGDVKNILQYALEKKVIPVSPNLLYAYLMTIVMGLHGLQIEKQAAEIRQNLKRLVDDFSRFSGNWEILGKHLRNAQSQYEEGDSKLNKFNLQLQQIQETDQR